MMDDFSIVDERLVRALHHIRRVNQWTQGYRATMRVLQPFLLKHRQGPIRILDIGTGIADFPVEIVRWSAVQGIDVHVYALDANATTIAEAQAWVDQELPDERAESITLDVKNIMNTSFDTGAFDVVHAAMFMHHFNQQEGGELCRRMQKWAKYGLLINDLHRHAFAYFGIRALAKLLPVSPMFAYDAPLSVLRGFRRDDLVELAEAAALPSPHIQRSLGFRWLMTTLPYSS